MPSSGAWPVDRLWLGQLPKKQQTSTAWVMESPMAAIESGRGGGAASAAGPAAEAGVAVLAKVPARARTRAIPKVRTRSSLAISDLPGREKRDAGQRVTEFSVAA